MLESEEIWLVNHKTWGIPPNEVSELETGGSKSVANRIKDKDRHWILWLQQSFAIKTARLLPMVEVSDPKALTQARMLSFRVVKDNEDDWSTHCGIWEGRSVPVMLKSYVGWRHNA